MFDIDDHPVWAPDQLWRDHADRMLRYATFVVGPDDAHDVVVEAFLSASQTLAAGPNTNEESFLIGAVRNRARDLHRSRQRRWRRDLAAVGPRAIDCQDTFAEVRVAVSRLSLMQRSVVFFTYWEDRTERDIAEIMSISSGTVHRHLERARSQLGKALR